jgi:hypothetical protein
MAALDPVSVRYHSPIWLGKPRPRNHKPANDIRKAAEKAFQDRLRQRIANLTRSDT